MDALVPFVLLARLLVTIIQGLRITGKFFVIGHHAIKYRTCPRIRIVEDE